MEARFHFDFSRVRVHADPPAARSAVALGASAYAAGRDLVFAPGRYHPWSAAGQRLLAHELAHVVQQGAATSLHPGPSAVSPGDLEADADRAAERVTRGLDARVAARADAPTVQLSPAPDEEGDDSISATLPGWSSPTDSLLALWSDRSVILLPASGIVYAPSSEALASPAGRSRVVVGERDLGPLLVAPAVGAGGTRLVQIGSRSALALDAGSDTMGVPAVVFMRQFEGALASINVTRVKITRILHVHADHVNRLAALVSVNRKLAVQVPAAYLKAPVYPSLRRVIDELRATLGPSWSPESLGAGGSHPEVAYFSAQFGGVLLESVALRADLRAVSEKGKQDAASLLTRVTRLDDGAVIVVLGDLRLHDLARIHDAMERARSGWWAEFFERATLSGFSHHAGALSEKDLPGLMMLLDATLLRSGRLRVVEQTNVRNTTQVNKDAREATLALLRNLGADVAYTDSPTGEALPSAVVVTRDELITRGPDAHRQDPSPRITVPLGALDGLIKAREALLRQGHSAGSSPKIKEIDGLIDGLRTSLRAAAEAEARVTVARKKSPAERIEVEKVRDDARRSLPKSVPPPAKTGGGLPGEPSPAEALEAAFREQRYSDQAFRLMLAQIDPQTRDSILYTERGSERPRTEQFRRLRAEFGFRASVLPSGEHLSVNGFSRGGAVGARGLAGAMAVLELGNSVIPMIQGLQASAARSRLAATLPFARRILFWNQLGVAPAVVAVNDPDVGSFYEERDPKAVVAGFQEGEWEALYIEHTPSRPSLSDFDVMKIGVYLAYYVRNFDEFATLFLDSNQDAVQWINGDKPGWDNALWQVRVGYYETEGTNRIVERWETHPRLTQLMQATAKRIIANTAELLKQRGAAAPQPGVDSSTSPLGGLETTAPPTWLGDGGKPRRAHLVGTPNPPKTTTVQVPASGARRGHVSVQTFLPREVTWSTPPVFFVHASEQADHVTVSAADYNTFATLRSLTTERYYYTMFSDEVEVIRNVTGVVSIPSSQIQPE